MERQPRRRRRPALSCIECRRRKIKCDRNEPCAHCISTKVRCTYKVYHEPFVQQQDQGSDSGNRTLSPSAYAPSPVVQNQRVNAETQSTEHASHSTEANFEVPLQHEISRVIGCNGNESSGPERDAGADLRVLSQRLESLEKSLKSHSTSGLAEADTGGFSNQSRLQEVPITLNKTRVSRSGRWMGTVQELTLIGACYAEASGSGDGTSFQDAESKTLTNQIGKLLSKCKDIARSVKLGPPNRFLSFSGNSLTPPSRELSDKMVLSYFQSFESVYRIIHAPTFWSEYETFWEYPEAVKPDSRLKILLVIGIGSSVSDHRDEDATFRTAIHQWVRTAQAWLSGPLKKDRLEITGLQICCLTILARQIFSIGGDLVWMSVGSLVYRAMQMGLHRDPRHLPSMSVLQAEVRRRLWATILEMVAQSSLDSAMPSRVSFDEFDTEPPSNNDDNEMDDSTTALPFHPRNVYTETLTQLTLLDSLPTRLRILQLLNGLNNEISYLDVLKLSCELNDAYRELGAFMGKNESKVTAFHRNLLHYVMRRFGIALYSPFISQARTNPLFYYALQASVDTAMTIVSPEPDESFSRLMAIGGGMFREGVRLAVTVLSLELIAQTETHRLDGTLHRNTQYREHLKQAMRDIMSYSIERIRQGETNVKLHTYVSMVMAQVEAVETGASCELKIAQSAKDSLEFCHGLLQARADAVSLPNLDNVDPTSIDLGLGQEGYDFDLGLDFFLSDAGFS